MKGNCIVCGTEIEINMCCSGRECGCMGQPTEPPVCSSECNDELMSNMEKYYPKGDIQPVVLHPSITHLSTDKPLSEETLGIVNKMAEMAKNE